MEHADGGDLSSAIQKRKGDNKTFAEDEVMRIFVQICKHIFIYLFIYLFFL